MARGPTLIRLSHDHHHGLALALRCRKQALGQMKPMGMEGLKERATEVRNFFAQSLERHFLAEEGILFPAIDARSPESHSVIEALIEDHQKIRSAAQSLENRVDVAKNLFDFGDLLERHIRREERELFPLFEKHVTEDEAKRVKRRIEEAFQEGPS